MRARRTAFLVLALLGGCATEREVKVALPITRLELPDAGPRRFDLAVGTGAREQALLTSDQRTVPPNPSAPLLTDRDDGLLRFDANLHPLVSVSAKASGGLAGLQGKFMPLHDGPFKLALTASGASGDETFEYDDGTTFARTSAKSSLFDAALILGVQLQPTLELYGGPWVSRLHYHGHHFSNRGSNPDFATDYEGDLHAHGGNLGIATTFGHWGRLLLEYSHARIRGGTSREEIGRGALALEIYFGKRHRAPPDEDAPVKVVPVDAPEQPAR